MFIGEYHYNLDQKGRLAIPAKFRKNLLPKVVITRGLDFCLFVYPLKEWQVLLQKLTQLPLSQSDSRAFGRFMIAGAVEEELDRQGRILIPEYLREFAQLRKKVVIIGLNNRLEIWDEMSWKEYKEKTEKEAVEIAEKLTNLGI